jgi:hypothetical protein
LASKRRCLASPCRNGVLSRPATTRRNAMGRKKNLRI